MKQLYTKVHWMQIDLFYTIILKYHIVKMYK